MSEQVRKFWASLGKLINKRELFSFEIIWLYFPFCNYGDLVVTQLRPDVACMAKRLYFVTNP